ncbi:MAG TPA: hypothetical protein VFW07_24615 [Parafilimonas sp.]|nr:hypothetical protein [Parafilimonas sp.]
MYRIKWVFYGWEPEQVCIGTTEFTSATGSQFTNIMAINDSILWLATLNGMIIYNMASGQKNYFQR